MRLRLDRLAWKFGEKYLKLEERPTTLAYTGNVFAGGRLLFDPIKWSNKLYQTPHKETISIHRDHTSIGMFINTFVFLVRGYWGEEK